MNTHRLLLLLSMLASACMPQPTTTIMRTYRNALAPMPAPPVGLAGGSGLGAGIRLLPTAHQPRPSDGAVTFPVVQLEPSGILRFPTGTSITARVIPVPGDSPMQAPTGRPLVSERAFTTDATLGVAQDFSFGSRWGLTVAGEVGLLFVGLTVRSEDNTASSDVSTVTVPSGRAGAVGFFQPVESVRLFLGGAAGVSVANDALGSRTETCSFTCSTVETGSVSAVGMMLVGAGVRFQPLPFLSIGLDAWVPMYVSNTRVPFTASATLRFGDFEVKRAPPKPVTPPPLVEAPPELPPPPPPP